MDRLVLIIAILPTILLWLYINKLDKHKEPKKFLLKLFFGGILSLILTLVISLLLSLIYTDFFTYKTTFDLTGFLYCFLGIGLVEETSKFIMLYLMSWKNKNFDETYDIVLYAMIVALGFATTENILYSLQNGLLTAILRFFTAVPCHVVNGAFMGYFLCLYRLNSEDKKNLFLAIFVPSLLHGIYDFLGFTTKTTYDLIYLGIFIIVVFVIAARLIRKMAKNSKSLPLFTINCENCGNPIDTRYCPHCGKERRK